MLCSQKYKQLPSPCEAHLKIKKGNEPYALYSSSAEKLKIDQTEPETTDGAQNGVY
jgi:hypothetical protein